MGVQFWAGVENNRRVKPNRLDGSTRVIDLIPDTFDFLMVIYAKMCLVRRISVAVYTGLIR